MGHRGGLSTAATRMRKVHRFKLAGGGQAPIPSLAGAHLRPLLLCPAQGAGGRQASACQVSIPRYLGHNTASTHPQRLVGRGAVWRHPSRPLPCTFPPIWGWGLHMHTHTTDSHTRQLEALVLPMKIRSINSHSLAGAEEYGRAKRDWEWQGEGPRGCFLFRNIQAEISLLKFL